MTLTIVGLGPGDIDDISRRAWQALEQAEIVFLHTAKYPCIPDLPLRDYQSFDNLDRESIVEKLLNAAQSDDIVYAVQGDPYMDDPITPELVETAKAHQIDVNVIKGVSLLSALGTYNRGVQIIDGLSLSSMHHPPINPEFPAWIRGVDSQTTASTIKQVLLNQYSDDFEVRLVHGVDTETLILSDIDATDQFSPITSLYIPKLEQKASFEHFQEIIAHLRAPEGCPWDRKQTHKSLRQYLLEEAYEVLDAIDNDDMESLAEELGDLMLQIVLHTQIAIDNGEFRMADVLQHINGKMIRRHPHVFGTVNVDNADEVVTNWEALKRQEKRENGKSHESLLDSIPKALPALLLSLQYQNRAAKVGFDWPRIDDVREKLNEELDEVMQVLDDPEKLQDEVGDVLFVLVNWVRWLKIDPENALREANAKFYRRFTYIEQQVNQNGKQMTDYTLAELDVFWDEAKLQGL